MWYPWQNLSFRFLVSLQFLFGVLLWLMVHSGRWLIFGFILTKYPSYSPCLYIVSVMSLYKLISRSGTYDISLSPFILLAVVMNLTACHCFQYNFRVFYFFFFYDTVTSSRSVYLHLVSFISAFSLALGSDEASSHYLMPFLELSQMCFLAFFSMSTFKWANIYLFSFLDLISPVVINLNPYNILSRAYVCTWGGEGEREHTWRLFFCEVFKGFLQFVKIDTSEQQTDATLGC